MSASSLTKASMPRLYAIIDQVTLSFHKFAFLEFAEELRDAGVSLLQYRDKSGAPQEVLRAAARITAVFDGSGAALILNDRADLAALVGWGVHVGQDDLSPADARAVLRRDSRFPSGMTTRKTAAAAIGVSTHCDEQVIAADASDADYIAVGPIFATSTKQN